MSGSELQTIRPKSTEAALIVPLLVCLVVAGLVVLLVEPHHGDAILKGVAMEAGCAPETSTGTLEAAGQLQEPPVQQKESEPVLLLGWREFPVDASKGELLIDGKPLLVEEVRAVPCPFVCIQTYRLAAERDN